MPIHIWIGQPHPTDYVVCSYLFRSYFKSTNRLHFFLHYGCEFQNAIKRGSSQVWLRKLFQNH